MRPGRPNHLSQAAGTGLHGLQLLSGKRKSYCLCRLDHCGSSTGEKAQLCANRIPQRSLYGHGNALALYGA